MSRGVPAERRAGEKHGRLLILHVYVSGGRRRAKCLCECGSEHTAELYSIVAKRIKSCGCLHRERSSAACAGRNTTHGLSGTMTYRAWKAMKRRCYNKEQAAYPRYGGRGIIVCDRWLNSFGNFLSDMGERLPGTTLDRINNNGNYEPSNCRWATPKQQARNMRRNVCVTAFGETKTISEWSDDERCAVTYGALRSRLASGVSSEEAIARPSRYASSTTDTLVKEAKPCGD